ncbi:MAG: type II toxin-antitoxin system VapC family toxin [Rhodospirillales bacterium]|nr:type II toxin-antitoxin system VapC family toxin [Rhodospirillales bacterium]
MKITADTNLLLRAALGDDAAQQRAALDVLRAAETVAIGAQSLAEFAWVLQRGYRLSRGETAAAIRKLFDLANVALDRPAVEAGLAMLEAGGDFADGIVAHQGQWLGGEVFASFDRKAVELLRRQGQPAMLVEGEGGAAG